jgi:hypothetical protein
MIASAKAKTTPSPPRIPTRYRGCMPQWFGRRPFAMAAGGRAAGG